MNFRSKNRNPVEIWGAEAVIAGLRRFGERGTRAAMGVTRETTEGVLREAKVRVPKDRPQLVHELISRYNENRVRGYVTNTRKGAHARLLEFGTRRMKAQPFMFPAAESYRLRHQQRMRQALQVLIARTNR